MLNRPLYLEQLLKFKDKQLIKIVSGVRRCGKSTLFLLYQEHLLKNGVRPEQIQSIDLEDPAYRELLNWEKLYDYINARLLTNKKNYIFLDEIQNIPDFQRAADGLFIKKNVDLYLTGSNSRLQSGQWATMLSGRYVVIQMFPLSFKEYVSAFADKSNLELKFQQYLENSSFPQILEFRRSEVWDKNGVRSYLQGIYNTIVLKDVVENKKIKNIGQLESVIKFLADNIGAVTSMHNIAKTLTADGRAISTHTVENYINALCDSYVLYRAARYDVKGKKLLQTLDKYYLVDIGLRYFLLGDQKTDSGRALENVVYLELLRRGSKVSIGKVGDKEVDFIAEGWRGTEYYQVAETVRAEATLRRELSPLNVIRNHNPKFLLTRDFEPRVSHNGIQQLNVLNWLLQD
ncbi:MAG: ATP-binding protein [Candidatus Margulisbacteria bacterium]|nr:ATP-binding protein [Candidatus Margulisiibacteriota bacterium]